MKGKNNPAANVNQGQYNKMDKKKRLRRDGTASFQKERDILT